MKVVIIGSTGQLAQDLLKVFGENASGLNHQDLDVTDGVGALKVLQELRPDLVINTAAYHRVAECEVNPSLSFAVNTLGAHNVARAAAAIAAGVVFFSTDYVFSGEDRHTPYIEHDSPKPMNVYGASKLAGEQLVMLGNPRHLVVRSTGLYGIPHSRRGLKFPDTILNKGRTEGLVRVVTDQVLAPTFTADLAAMVKQLVERDANGLFHLTNSGECSWFEFAREIFELAHIHVKMEPIRSDLAQQRVRRPSYSALASVRLAEVGLKPMRPWNEALKDYLCQKGVVT
jgi:dTDP-4-dehydrorhamnose reductase